MPKTGRKRSIKFSVKHDPDVLLLRWKALRDFATLYASKAVTTHDVEDALISELIKLFNIPFGLAGQFHDKLKRLVSQWDILTESEKQILRDEWIKENLPIEIFNLISAFISEFKAKSQISKKNVGYLTATLKIFPKQPEPEKDILTTIEELIAYYFKEEVSSVLSCDLDFTFQYEKQTRNIQNPLCQIEDLNLSPKLNVVKNVEIPNIHIKTFPKPSCKLENLTFEPKILLDKPFTVTYLDLIKELRVNNLAKIQTYKPIVKIDTTAYLTNKLESKIKVSIPEIPPIKYVEKIINGSFETGDDEGWIGRYYYITNEIARTGLYSLVIGFSDGGVWQNLISPVPRQNIQSFGFWYRKIENMGFSGVYAVINQGEFICQGEEAIFGEWKYYDILAQLPQDISPIFNIQIWAYGRWGEAFDAICIDDISLIAKE